MKTTKEKYELCFVGASGLCFWRALHADDDAAAIEMARYFFDSHTDVERVELFHTRRSTTGCKLIELGR